eukprot:1160086-Pelagomonas_calceolata.AAC.8
MRWRMHRLFFLHIWDDICNLYGQQDWANSCNRLTILLCPKCLAKGGSFQSSILQGVLLRQVYIAPSPAIKDSKTVADE